MAHVDVQQDGPRKRRRLSADESAISSEDEDDVQPPQTLEPPKAVISRIKPREVASHVTPVPADTEIDNGKVVDSKSSFATLTMADRFPGQSFYSTPYCHSKTLHTRDSGWKGRDRGEPYGFRKDCSFCGPHPAAMGA